MIIVGTAIKIIAADINGHSAILSPENVYNAVAAVFTFGMYI